MTWNLFEENAAKSLNFKTDERQKTLKDNKDLR